MKKILFLFISVAFTATSNADQYKILHMNTSSINIGGKSLHVGDTFDEEMPIKWESEKQAMKVLNTKTKKIRLFVSKQFSKSNSIKDLYLKQNHLSTRSSDLMDENELGEYLSNHFFLLDYISFSSILMVDETAYFTIEINGKEHVLGDNNGDVCISRSLFDEQKKQYIVSIFYLDKNDNSKLLITDKMVVELLPLFIK